MRKDLKSIFADDFRKFSKENAVETIIRKKTKMKQKQIHTDHDTKNAFSFRKLKRTSLEMSNTHIYDYFKYISDRIEITFSMFRMYLKH